MQDKTHIMKMQEAGLLPISSEEALEAINKEAERIRNEPLQPIDHPNWLEHYMREGRYRSLIGMSNISTIVYVGTYW